MNNQRDWIEYILKWPSWIKGSIGLVTLIIGFVILFRNNLYLSITISIAVTLLTVFCYTIYLAFSKKESTILGAGRVYRFPRYRNIALIVMAIILVLVVILLANSSSQAFVFVTFVGTPTPNNKLNLPSPCEISLQLSVPSATPIPDDKLQIESLIRNEAQAVLDRDISKIMTLFRSDSVIQGIKGDTLADEWKGCSSISNHYQVIFEYFVSLEHKIITLDIDGDSATATTFTEGDYYVSSNSMESKAWASYEPHLVHGTTTEKWRFVKDAGIWRVITFIYGLP